MDELDLLRGFHADRSVASRGLRDRVVALGSSKTQMGSEGNTLASMAPISSANLASSSKDGMDPLAGQQQRRTRGLYRNKVLTSVVALLLVVGGVAGFALSHTQQQGGTALGGVGVIELAYHRLLAVRSLHFQTTEQIEAGSTPETITTTGVVTGVENGPSGVAERALTTSATPQGKTAVELILAHRVLYVRRVAPSPTALRTATYFGYRVSSSGPPATLGVQNPIHAGPVTLLRRFAQSGVVTTSQSANIDGQVVTRYQARVKIGAILKADAGEIPSTLRSEMQLLGKDAPVALWINRHGQLLREVVTVPFTVSGYQFYTIDTLNFSAYNVPVTVTAPSTARVTFESSLTKLVQAVEG
ncbi:hypothetical protein [Ferrimicrobium sp.]|uniref:hypothetical protein n=1 Tax=Ferrimicrobium sp. TaxID=2926050 RepID=UPI002635860B|nr:hypothetical protein [Ferrimicrobium sp.]